MSVTFEQARELVAAAGKAEGDDTPVAPWGWENDTVFVLAFDYGDEPQFGDELPVVNKATGVLEWAFNPEVGEPVAPGLRPINNPPE